MRKTGMTNNATVTLRVDSRKDQELLAKALRDSCFAGLTVKQFHADEARDVLLYLWALTVEGQKERPQ